MEAVFLWQLLLDVLGTLLAGVELFAIDICNECKYIFSLALRVVCFKGIAFDNKQSIVVVCSHLGRFPCQPIHFYMSVPFSRHDRRFTIHHMQTVKDKNISEVSLCGQAFANIDNDKVSVSDPFLFAILLHIMPHVESAILFLSESKTLQGILSCIGIAVNLAFPSWRLAGRAELLYIFRRENDTS